MQHFSILVVRRLMSSVVFFLEVRLDRFGFYDTARAVRPEWPPSRERQSVKVIDI